MHGDERADVFKARRNRARQHPRRQIVPQMTLREEAQVEAELVGLAEHGERVIVLRVAPPFGQGRERFRRRLRDLRRADGRHRDGSI